MSPLFLFHGGGAQCLGADSTVVQTMLSGAAVVDVGPAAGGWVCRSCGTENSRGSTRCRCGQRRTKAAAERRAQYRRKDGRTIQDILEAFRAITEHRGGELSKLSQALLTALREKADTSGEDLAVLEESVVLEDLLLPQPETRTIANVTYIPDNDANEVSALLVDNQTTRQPGKR